MTDHPSRVPMTSVAEPAPDPKTLKPIAPLAAIALAATDATLTVEVLNPAQPARVRITLADGGEHIVPASFMQALMEAGGDAWALLDRISDIAQLRARHPLLRHPDLLPIPPDEKPDQVQMLLLPSLPDQEPGDPYLEWGVREHGGELTNGWGLHIRGIGRGPIGWAAWNDRRGQDGLIRLMQDETACHTLASALYAWDSAVLNARQAVNRFRQQRRLPSISLAKATSVLGEAGIHGGRLRNFTINSGDAMIPIAVAAIPSATLGQELHGVEWNLPAAQQSRILRQRGQRATKLWRQSVQSAVAAVGWRVVELPSLDGESPTSNAVYFTRIPEDLWDVIAPAAAEDSRSFDAGRGGVSL